MAIIGVGVGVPAPELPPRIPRGKGAPDTTIYGCADTHTPVHERPSSAEPAKTMMREGCTARSWRAFRGSAVVQCMYSIKGMARGIPGDIIVTYAPYLAKRVCAVTSAGSPCSACGARRDTLIRPLHAATQIPTGIVLRGDIGAKRVCPEGLSGVAIVCQPVLAGVYRRGDDLRGGGCLFCEADERLATP
ncbi:uncharacterized protein N7459_000616 [Penicillium hispanicum]|uniref:uncharacterized protein n=1 Tax=Penicillium hispanicum TaxID=1080232 RepID=UPI00254269E8|nr:uncharacterized protein N7459_000616 [Penicillium hispanicum]KAJ5594408.1 hypothetical protein N7459_000616 [Penicillium hispanicum]